MVYDIPKKSLKYGYAKRVCPSQLCLWHIFNFAYDIQNIYIKNRNIWNVKNGTQVMRMKSGGLTGLPRQIPRFTLHWIPNFSSVFEEIKVYKRRKL